MWLSHGESDFWVADVFVTDGDDSRPALVSDFEDFLAVFSREGFLFAEADVVIHGLGDVDHAFCWPEVEERPEVGDVCDFSQDDFLDFWQVGEDIEFCFVECCAVSWDDDAFSDVEDVCDCDCEAYVLADVPFKTC